MSHHVTKYQKKNTPLEALHPSGHQKSYQKSSEIPGAIHGQMIHLEPSIPHPSAQLQRTAPSARPCAGRQRGGEALARAAGGRNSSVDFKGIVFFFSMLSRGKTIGKTITSWNIYETLNLINGGLQLAWENQKRNFPVLSQV